MSVPQDGSPSQTPPVGDREALQAIIDNPKSSAQERMKAIELKARLDGKIGHGRGEKEPSEMGRDDLELFVSDGLAELERRRKAQK